MLLHKIKYYIWLFIVGIALCSCVKDDVDDCGIDILFQYNYNIKNANAFGNEVQEVNLWVFDESGKLISQYFDRVKNHGNNFKMNIPNLVKGNYTFVSWANDNKRYNDVSNYELSSLKKGDDINTLYARLRRIDNHFRSELNNTLMGKLSAAISGENETLTISMMKVTHKVRLLLVPTSPIANIASEDFDFTIHGNNGWLAHDGTQFQDDPLIYHPYYQEKIIDSRSSDAISSIIAAEISTSRLIYDQPTRLKIVQNGEDMIDINLTWFLALQGIGEHKAEWSNQEYLDRQDYHTITFFVDGDTWMKNRIIINGWVVSLNGVDFK